MKKLEIIIPLGLEERTYMVKILRTKFGIEANEKEHKNYVSLSFEVDCENEDELKKFIAKAIVIFNKFRLLNIMLKDTKISKYDKYALIGALLGIEKQREDKITFYSLKNLQSISTKCLIDFKLKRLTHDWLSLVELTNTLTTNITSEKDVYELISYFISGMETGPKVIITDTSPPRLAINGEVLDPIPLTPDEDVNLILSVVSEHPSHIVIKNQELLSPRLLNTLRSLGQ